MSVPPVLPAAPSSPALAEPVAAAQEAPSPATSAHPAHAHGGPAPDTAALAGVVSLAAAKSHKGGLWGFVVRFSWRFLQRWGEDTCPLLAAALAFFGALSLFPLVLAGVTILAYVLSGNAAAERAFAHFSGSFFPGMAATGVRQEIAEAVRTLTSSPDTKTVSRVALISLLWSGRAYFDTVAFVVNRIWPGTQPRPWWQHQLTLWGLMFGTGLLFLLSSGASFILSMAQATASTAPDLFINHNPHFWGWLGRLSAWALTYLMFYLLYHYAPRRTSRHDRRVVVAVALVASFDWEAAKWLFGHLLRDLSHYQAIYGSVAGIAVTMVWIYLSSLIILVGAECAATWEDLVVASAPEKLSGATPSSAS